MRGYQGIFLDQQSMEKLEQKQGKRLSNVIRDMHITFNFGNVERFPEELANETFNIKVIGYGNNDKNSGFMVKLPERLNDLYKNDAVPHITVSIGIVDGVMGKPVETKNLHFKPLKEEFEVTGRLGTIVFLPERKSKFCLGNTAFDEELEHRKTR